MSHIYSTLHEFVAIVHGIKTFLKEFFQRIAIEFLRIPMRLLTGLKLLLERLFYGKINIVQCSKNLMLRIANFTLSAPNAINSAMNAAPNTPAISLLSICMHLSLSRLIPMMRLAVGTYSWKCLSSWNPLMLTFHAPQFSDYNLNHMWPDIGYSIHN